MIATGTAILAGILASSGTGVAQGIMGSRASKKAAMTQADAAKYSADLQYKAGQEANQLQKEQYDKAQETFSPWIEAGQGALGKLKDLSGSKGFTKQFDPNSVEFDPGFQARMDQSSKALQTWAASRGTLMSGGTGTKLIKNAQQLTSGEYQNAWNRKMGEYQTEFNVFNNNQANEWDRLAQLAGFGQNSTMGLNQAGQNFATTVGNTKITTSQNIGGAGEGAANANAAGGVGSANAWNNALAIMNNGIQGGMTMSMLNNNPGLYRQLNPGYTTRRGEANI